MNIPTSDITPEILYDILANAERRHSLSLARYLSKRPIIVAPIVRFPPDRRDVSLRLPCPACTKRDCLTVDRSGSDYVELSLTAAIELTLLVSGYGHQNDLIHYYGAFCTCGEFLCASRPDPPGTAV